MLNQLRARNKLNIFAIHTAKAINAILGKAVIKAINMRF